jgi:hypothetical protein
MPDDKRYHELRTLLKRISHARRSNAQDASGRHTF